MSLATPWALLLLAALPLLVWIAWRRWSSLGRWRDLAGLAARLLIASLVVLALAGLQWSQRSDRLVTIFLLDVSDSMGQAARESGLAYVRQALAAMGPEDGAGLVLFGADALVERPVSGKPGLAEPAAIVNGRYTNIAKAVRLGLSLFPPDSARRLVILSDGGANVDDARQAVQLAQAGGVEVAVVPLARAAGVEVRLDELRAPAALHRGEHFDLTVKIHSTTAMSAPLQVFNEGRLAAQEDLSLRAGDNTFVLPLVAGAPGFTTFQARLAPPADTFPQNNRLDAASEVRGPLSVWVVAGQPDEAQPLVTALRATGLVVRESGPTGFPVDLARLSDVAAVVLVDVPAPQLTLRQQTILQSYVRDLGRGLVVIGGEQSYGPGGYFQTPLEEMLPVEMTIRDKTRLPGLTLLPIIDKSGSMADGGTPFGGGPRKIELAKEAIYRSVDLLVPYLDRIGLVAFDNAAEWVIEPTPVEDTERIKAAVGTLRASGGTDILAGLQLGAEAILREPSRVRHIILLTDGGANPGGIPELTRELAGQGVTVSVVAIGQGYAPFLEDIARIGGGRFYVAVEAAAIPQIFAQETSLASRSYIVEETFTPQPAGASLMLAGLGPLPPLQGYVATSPKLTAQVLLRGGQEQDPLLAQWQYGLGRAVAWTSDAKGQWAGDWITWPDFPSFWSQVIRWTIVEGAPGGLESQVRLEENWAVVTAEAVDAAGNFYNHLEMTLTVVDPDLKQQTIPLDQFAPGLYEGRFRPAEVGTYILQLTGKNGETAPIVQTRSFVVAYSPEYRDSQLDVTLLSDLAAIGRGRVLSLDAPAEAFRHSLPPAEGVTPLWPWLLLAAAFLLPVDVALRRVVMGREDVRRAWASLHSHLPRPARPPVAEQSSAARLLKVKGKKTRATSNDTPPAIPLVPGRPSGVDQTLEAGAKIEPASAPSPTSTPALSDRPGEATTLERLKRAKQRRRDSSQS